MIPPLLTEKIRAVYGARADEAFAGFSAEGKTTFRVNTLKTGALERITGFLEANGIPYERWDFPDAFTVEKRFEYALKGSEPFYRGDIYLQSIASQLSVLVLAPLPKERILDATWPNSCLS